MRFELTPKQQKFLEYMQHEISRAGKAPSLRRAARVMGVSHAAVGQMLKTLEEKGYLRRAGHYSRTVHLLNRSGQTVGAQRSVEVPIVGRVTAGLPMYAQQEWEGSVILDSEIFHGRDLFALHIRGDSMQDAGILNGDLAICEPRQFAQNGEIVVDLINGEEATVKRFFLFEDRIELRPENSAYKVTRYGFGDVMVQGKVIGIHRGPEGICHES